MKDTKIKNANNINNAKSFKKLVALVEAKNSGDGISSARKRKIGIFAVILLCFGISLVLASFFSKKDAFPANPIVLKTSTGEEIKITEQSTLHMPFIKNEGQVENDAVRYYSSVPSGAIYVENGQLTYNLKGLHSLIDEKNKKEENSEEKRESDNDSKQEKTSVGAKGLAFTEKLLNIEGNPILFEPIGENEAYAKFSYYTGNDQAKWKNNILTNNTVGFGQVYNRISFNLRAYEGNIEKLFLVEDGGYPGEIAIQMDGVEKISVSDKGELTVTNQDVSMSFTKPIAYQLINGAKQFVATRYVLKDQEKKIYGFEVGDYDKSQPLIIDPLIASTYLGGSREEHYAYNDFGGQFHTGRKSLLEDIDGSIYVIGYSQSTDYPTTLGVYDDTYNDSTAPLPNDVVISKFNADLTQLLASTYLGGNSEDIGAAIVMDEQYIYLTGYTRSQDFPTTNNAYSQNFNGGDSDIFLSKLTKDLTTLTASTYVGGNGKDYGYSLVKNGATVYLAGDTESYNFPVVAGSYDTQKNGISDAFILSLPDTLATVSAGTFIGGTQDDYARAMTKDSAGNIFITGFTTSLDFPANTNSLNNHGGTDGYVARLNSELTTLINATYVGGSYTDRLTTIAINSDNDVIVAGSTNSTDMGMNGYQKIKKGGYDGLILLFNSNLGQTKGSTYLGGDNQELVYDVTVDATNNVFVVGSTQSNNFPIDQYAWSTTLNGLTDGFVVQLSKSLSGLNYATYFGGDGGVDHIFAAKISNDDKNVLLYGVTNSTNFPVTVNAYDQNANGQRDLFISKITKDLRRNSWPDHLVVTTVSGDNTATVTAGQTQTVMISAKDPLNRTVENLNGNYPVRLFGAALSPTDRQPTCNGIALGEVMTLTFVDGKATCDGVFYAAENMSLDAETTIDGVKYASTNEDIWDLDFTVNPATVSHVGSSIDAKINPTIVGRIVNLTLIANDEYGNSVGQGGGTVVFTVTGKTNLTVNGTDNGNGTYVAQYTAAETTGEDLITATLNGTLVGRDTDGTPDGAFHLPLVSEVPHHMELRYERADGTLLDSFTAVAGEPVKMVILVKDQYGNNVTDYDEYHSIKITPGSQSPYGNQSYTTGSCQYNSCTLGGNYSYYFTDGVAKTTAYFTTPQTVQLEATDGTVSTEASDDYDLNANIAVAAMDHIRIDGNTSQTAGVSQPIIVTAKDRFGNDYSAYSGNHNINFLGADLSPNGTASTVKNKNGTPISFGSPTALSFINGQATTEMILNIKADVEVDVTDGAYNSAGSSNYDLNVKVSSSGVPSPAESVLAYLRDPIYTNAQAGILVTLKDAYGNQLEGGSHNVVVAVSGANSATINATNKGNGTYLAVYLPTNTGTDIATATVDGGAILKDTEGVSDGFYHIAVNEGISNVRHWNGSKSSDWFDPKNWVENSVPDEGSTVVIDGNIQGVYYFYNPTLNSTAKTITIANLDLGLGTDPNATPVTLTLQFVHLDNPLNVTGNVHIGSQGTLTHSKNDNLFSHMVNLNVGGDVIVDNKGKISLLDKGCKNGITSHGGVGNSGEPAYGNLFEPTDPGSSTFNNAGAGGGVFKLNASNLNNYGEITVSANNGSENSGGSIFVTVDNLVNEGIIAANGGSQGAGGRIALYYKQLYSSEQNIQAAPAYNVSGKSGAGTIYLKNLNETLGTLIVDGNRSNDNKVGSTPQYIPAFAQQTQNPIFKKIVVRRGGQYEVNEGGTLNLDPTVTQIDGDGTGTIMNRGTITFPEITSYVAPIGCLYNEGVINNVKNLTLQGGIDLCPNPRGTTQYPLNLSVSAGSGMEFYDYLPATTPFVVNHLTVGQDAIITHRVNQDVQQHMINLEVLTDMIVNNGGQINVDGAGYAGGEGPGYSSGASSYAGLGGSKGGTHGAAYGSIIEPIDLGSNKGGGAAKIKVHNKLINNGVFSANGKKGTGGSLWLTADEMNGVGSFSADATRNGSLIGGGRIALYYNSSNLVQTPKAYGGCWSNSSCGGAGTVYLRNLNESNGELIVDNGNNWISGDKFTKETPQYTNQTDQKNREMTFKTIHVKGGARYQINPEATLTIISPELMTGNSDFSLIENRGTVNLPENVNINAKLGCFYNYGDWNGAKNLIFSGGIDFCPSSAGTIQNSLEMTFSNSSSLEMYDYTPDKALTAQKITLNSDGLITHPRNTGVTQQHMVNLKVADDVIINSGGKIDVSAKGYKCGSGPGSGSYPSYGGFGLKNSGESKVYGSIVAPTEIGSAYSSGNYGVNAGGAVKLQVGNRLLNQGGILANAEDVHYTGGSLWLKAKEIGGDGPFQANAFPLNYTSSNRYSGGGRVALYYDNLVATQKPQACGYSAGTVYLKNNVDTTGSLFIDNCGYNEGITPQYTDKYDYQNQHMTFKTLDIRGGGKYQVNYDATMTLLDPQIKGDTTMTSIGIFYNDGKLILPETDSVVWNNLPLTGIYNTGTIEGTKDLTITNGTKFYQSGGRTLGSLENLTIGKNSLMEMSDYNVNTPLQLKSLTIQNEGLLTHAANADSQQHVVNLKVDNLTIDPLGKIDVTGKGYEKEKGPGAGNGYGGAGYGGNGGVGSGSGAAGAAYGIKTYPIDLGSGGGGAYSGDLNKGGGAVKIQVGDTLRLDGAIIAEPLSNGSINKNGSGGSVMINTKKFDGTGFITANGIRPDNNNCGAGAGGRIAVYFQQQTFVDGGGSISENGAIKDPIAFGNAEGGTLYLSSPDHYQITGVGTQAVNTEQEITVALMDSTGNPFVTTGERQVIFSGASPSFNGTFPTTEDKFGNKVNFGDITVLDFVDGVATTKMVLYAEEEAEIEVEDGTYNSFGNPDFDLNVIVTALTSGDSFSSISVAPSPSKIPEAFTITVTTYDEWGNVVKTGGGVVELNVVGETTEAPVVNDNNNGTYTAIYIPPKPGEYQISGTINGQPIQRDTDGTSDGIYHQTVTGGDPHHLTVTGSSTQIAGQSQTVTVAVKDVRGFISSQYSGDYAVTFSGPQDAPNGSKPFCRDKNGNGINIGQLTTLAFNEGVATVSCTLYKAETVSIDAAVGTINSFGNADYDLDVTVTRADSCHGTVSYVPAQVYVGDNVTFSVNNLTDAFGNSTTTGGEIVSQSIMGANPQTLIITDNNDGTYQSAYTPQNKGNDSVTTQIGACSLNTVNLLVEASPEPACGPAAKTYAFAENSFSGSFCSAGTENIMPTFPTAGNSVSWDCVNYGKSVNCTAIHTAATTPVCGDAARTYQYSEMTFDGSFCATGTEVSIPIFPLAGKSVGWQCFNEGLTVDCVAQKNAATPPVCGTAAKNYLYTDTVFDGALCEIGVANPLPTYPEAGKTVTWECLNHSLSVQCLATRAIASPEAGTGEVYPQCGSAARFYLADQSNFSGNFCNVGNTQGDPIFPDLGKTVEWVCENKGQITQCAATRAKAEQIIPDSSETYPVCGSASQTYFAGDNKFIGTFCSLGTVDNEPDFPKKGATAHWKCLFNSKEVKCDAYRRNLDLNGGTIEGEISCKTKKVKSATDTSVILEVSVKNAKANSRRDFEVDAEDLVTGKKKTQLVFARISEKGRADLDVRDLMSNTNYRFKVYARGTGEYYYCPKSLTTETLPGAGSETTVPETGGIPGEQGLSGATGQTGADGQSVESSELSQNIQNEITNQINTILDDRDKVVSPVNLNSSMATDLQHGVSQGTADLNLDGAKPFLQVLREIAEKNALSSGLFSAGGFLAGLLVPIMSMLGSVPLALKDFFMIPLIGIFARRKGKNGWGVVFEQKTKQPLQGIAISLYATDGKKMETVYSDKAGRYGFMPKSGEYVIKVENRKFALNTITEDPVYGRTYPGGKILIKEKEIISFNISLVANGFDWEEYAYDKVQNHTFYKMRNTLLVFLYYLGFAWTIFATIINPMILNLIFLALYIGFFVYDHFVERREFGTIYQSDGSPVPFAMLSLNDPNTKQRKGFAVSNTEGRYYLLAEDGEYDLNLSGRLLSGVAFNREGNLKVRKGLVREDWEI